MMDHSYFNPRFKEAYKIFEKKTKEQGKEQPKKHHGEDGGILPKRSVLKEVLDDFK